jgi:hypothetical protein
MVDREAARVWSDRVICAARMDGRAKSDKRDDVRGEGVSGVSSEALAWPAG